MPTVVTGVALRCDRPSISSVAAHAGAAAAPRLSHAVSDRRPATPEPITSVGRLAALPLPLLAAILLLFAGSRGFGQSITLAPPTSSTTYVDSLTTSYSITGDSSAQQVRVVWTYTSGSSTASIGSTWTLTMKTPSLSQSFTLKPTDLTNSANAFTASPTTSMPEGFYSVYAQYVRPASAGSLTVTTTTRTNVYLDLYSQTPSFVSGQSVTIDTSTDIITLANHGLTNGTPVTVTGTNAPSTTTYYASVIDSSTFKLVTTPGGSTVLDFTTATSPKVGYAALASDSWVGGTTATVSCTIPEFYLAGSASLVFAGPTTVTLTLANNILTQRFSFDRTNIVTNANIAATSATTLPDGTYTVTLSYRDRYSHPAASVVLTNVTFAAATPAPSFTNLANNGSIAQGTAVTYSLAAPALPGSVNLTFNDGVNTIVLTRPDTSSGTFTFDRGLYGALIPSGTYSITLSYRDITGNPAASTTVTGITIASGPLLSTVDSDGDGLSDLAEYTLASLGFDWQVSQPDKVAAFLNSVGLYTKAQMDANRTAGQADVTGDPGAYSLYTLSQVQNLNVGTPLITRDSATGKWKLTIGLQVSSDLTNYTDFPFVPSGTSVNSSGQVEFVFTAAQSNAFFRLNAH